MLSTSPAAKIPLPFASSGVKRTIPETTAGISTPGQASHDVGFPAITMQPILSGGIPPAGADFNGILYEITAAIRWLQAMGGAYVYDAAFVADTNVGGYPKGALLLKSGLNGYWLNTVDGNATNPDTGGAGWSDLATVLGGGGGGGSGRTGAYAGISSYTASQALTAASDVNKLILCGGAGGTFSLPATSTCTNGDTITLLMLGGSGSVIPQGSDTILRAGTTIASLSFAQGDSVQFTKSGTSWYVSGGSVLMPYGAAFQAGRTASVKQTGLSPSSSAVSNTLSFTAPCAGKVIAFAVLNVGNELSSNLYNNVSINGGSAPIDYAALSQTQIAVGSLAGGQACTISQTVGTVSSVPSGTFSIILSYVFIPAQ